MKVSVTFRHMKPSDPIREYAEDRIDKITKIIDRGGEAQVVLSVEKHLHVAHIELLTEGALRIRSIEKTEDMYGSIDAAVKVLGESSTPLTTKQMIDAMAAQGYWKSPGGKTPDRTLYSAILREIATKSREARFVKTERGKFALKK